MSIELDQRPALELPPGEPPHGEGWDLSEPPPTPGSWRHGLWTVLLMVAGFGGVVGAFVLLGHVSAGAAGSCGGG